MPPCTTCQAQISVITASGLPTTDTTGQVCYCCFCPYETAHILWSLLPLASWPVSDHFTRRCIWTRPVLGSHYDVGRGGGWRAVALLSNVTHYLGIQLHGPLQAIFPSWRRMDLSSSRQTVLASTRLLLTFPTYHGLLVIVEVEEDGALSHVLWICIKDVNGLTCVTSIMGLHKTDKCHHIAYWWFSEEHETSYELISDGEVKGSIMVAMRLLEVRLVSLCSVNSLGAYQGRRSDRA